MSDNSQSHHRPIKIPNHPSSPNFHPPITDAHSRIPKFLLELFQTLKHPITKHEETRSSSRARRTRRSPSTRKVSMAASRSIEAPPTGNCPDIISRSSRAGEKGEETRPARKDLRSACLLSLLKNHPRRAAPLVHGFSKGFSSV